eukprot:XP_011673805.1 PREDICTED: uncharacterized protein LOC105442875 [Strongylocentrotus purpuratus]
MSVKVCREARGAAFTVVGMGRAMLDIEVVPYSCASKMDVEITFIAIRSGVAPRIGVGYIQIYETTYKILYPLVTKQPSTESFTSTTLTTSLEVSSVTQPSTESTSTNFQSKSHSPTSSTAPYAAIGGGVAAAVVVVCIIIIILVYRCK